MPSTSTIDLQIFDMQGRPLYAGRTTTTDFNLVLPHTGSYIIRLGTQLETIRIR